jgi:DNA repair photolyase
VVTLRPIIFEEYKTRRILNVHKHVDGPWFWCKYTAHPYVGCRHGCEFCYSRGERYSGRRDPDDFDTVIRVKINAVERLRKELAGKPRDVIVAGDWQQPAESRYRLSRGMLEVVRDYRLPLFIVERSHFLLRDLDLLREINADTRVAVAFSISSVDQRLKKAFEPFSPGTRQRLKAMRILAEAGILVGTALMPILPIVGDDRAHIEDTISATRDNGGTFVMAGGLTMDGVQARRTLDVARRLDPGLETKYRELYSWERGKEPSYGPPRGYAMGLGRMVRDFCTKHGVLDRVPRYILPGPLAVNWRIAEKLFLRTYDLELEEASSSRIWAYRRAAWTVNELPESVGEIYHGQGEAGLRQLPGIGQRLAGLIGRWLRDEGVTPNPPKGAD